MASGARALVYVLLNDAWDRVVGNRLDQQHRPLESPGQGIGRYLDYLVDSLGSFRRCHSQTATAVRVVLVEIARGGLDAPALKALLAERGAGEVRITTIGLPLVEPFLREARAVPLEHYRAPNALHEFAVLYTLRHAQERHLAFVDPDVTFVAPGAIDELFDVLAAAPHKWAAGFVERGKRRPWQGGWIEARERLHSVAALFDAAALQRQLPFALFLDPNRYSERLMALRDEAAVQYYSAYRMLDTFSLLTEYLRSQWFVDRLLDLGERVGHVYEGSMLTLVSDKLVHCKYREPGAHSSLVEALERSGLSPDLPEVASLLARCERSG